MNKAARGHLEKARGLLDKGESFYRKAAAEIVAAQKVDSSLSYAEIGEWFGRSKTWAREMTTWSASGGTSVSPYSGDGPFSRKTKGHQDQVSTRKVLRDAPLEQVERIISTLPRERQQAIGAAAGDAYFTARKEHDDREKTLTPAERKAREATRQSVREHTGRMMSGFNVFGITNHLDQATDVLKEMIEEQAVTRSGLRDIDKAVRRFLEEYAVARAMVGLETDLESVL